MDISWSDLISELRHSGMTYASIAEACGCAGSTIGDLAAGRSKCPRADTGIRLVRLHKKAMRRITAEPSANAA